MNELFNLKLKVSENRIKTSGAVHTLLFVATGKNAVGELKAAESLLDVKIDETMKRQLAEKPCSITVTPKARSLWFVTIIPVDAAKSFSPDFFRNSAAGFMQDLKDKMFTKAEIIIPDYQSYKLKFPSFEYFLQTFVEGVHYGNYTFDKYKSGQKDIKELIVTFICAKAVKMEQALKRAGNLMSSVKLTRDLQNESSAQLYPEAMAERLTEEFNGLPVKVTIYNKEKLAEMKMGGLLGVGAGSAHSPMLVVLEYQPSGALRHTAIVGKGVTFDSGGISLKPSADMWEMKGDMSGAAAAAGAVMAAAKSKLPIQLTAVLPLAENMPSGSALKPGDILTTSSGKTIEVDNTDAEGRLILADALHYASGLKPDLIIDLATLTGACVVALGEFVAGLFTCDDELGSGLFSSGLITNERVWRMPMWDDYKQLIKSDVADVKNVGGRWGGAITAAKFLENWVEPSIPWAHIDLCPAGPHKYNNYSQPYFTGFGVRLLYDFLSKKF